VFIFMLIKLIYIYTRDGSKGLRNKLCFVLVY